MKRRFLSFFSVFSCSALLLAAFPLAAQDFGFGFDDEDAEVEASSGGGGGGEAAAGGVSISGEVSASLLGYGKDFSDGLNKTRLGDVFSGTLKFSAGNAFGDAVIALKLSPTSLPVAFDEAYLRAYFGVVEIEGGLRKLTWGKADSLGPLDVINPLDYTEITDVSDAMNMKIARPLIHATARFGQFSKIEGVFVPTFEPWRFASEGRWAPGQMAQLQAINPSVVPSTPDIATLNYAQAGGRFTTTLGSSDIGVQYYYGRLPKPAVKMTFTQTPTPAISGIEFLYNPYHHIGVDWAQVLFGFNVRAEFAANITNDLAGDDGAVYNPHLAWSFGFDRDLFWGVNLNLQVNETITLLHDKIDPVINPMDIEAESDSTSTRLTALFSKKFLRDELEIRAAVLWGIEDKDFLIVPAIVWTRDAVSIEGSVGIFGGDEHGQLGYYHDNGFARLVLTYSF
ncbi:MAG: hypothetical protein LBP19_00735 [Treponema sp.]|nr:hypothetical protein [Treponema sp.]